MTEIDPIQAAIDSLLAGQEPDLSSMLVTAEDFGIFLLAVEDRYLAAQDDEQEEAADAAHNLVMELLLSVYSNHEEEEETKECLKELKKSLGGNKELDEDSIAAGVDACEDVESLLLSLGCTAQLLMQVSEAMESGKLTRKNEVLSNNASNHLDFGMQALRDILAD
jgi:hypothetical protein